MVAQFRGLSTSFSKLAGLTQSEVVRAVVIRETPFTRNDDPLLAGELVASAAERLDGVIGVAVASAHRNQRLANVNTGGTAVGLTPGTAHTLLETISSSARKHFVNTQNVEGVWADAHVEAVTAELRGQILVNADTRGLKCLRRDLLALVRDKVHAERELVNGRLLAAQIKRADLRVGNCAVVPRLRVRLVLNVSVATSRTSSHCS